MNIAVIDYNAGNVRSVLFALERIGITGNLTSDPNAIQTADKVIFPGVGEASTAMNHLRQTGLAALIPRLRQPFLGICLGMQVMCRHSEENNTDCLNIFDLAVRRFPTDANGSRFKVPQIGWNALHHLRSPLFEGVTERSFVYFVHSYFVEPSDHAIATADYSLPYCAAIQRDNFFATQFHPEKSAAVGARILENFVRL